MESVLPSRGRSVCQGMTQLAIFRSGSLTNGTWLSALSLIEFMQYFQYVCGEAGNLPAREIYPLPTPEKWRSYWKARCAFDQSHLTHIVIASITSSAISAHTHSRS